MYKYCVKNDNNDFMMTSRKDELLDYIVDEFKDAIADRLEDMMSFEHITIRIEDFPQKFKTFELVVHSGDLDDWR